MNRRLFITTAVSGALLASTSAKSRAAGRIISGLQTALRDEIAGAFDRLAFVPGMAVAVYSNGDSFADGFGIANIETAEPVTAETSFYIASSTKPLTALTLARLHERGDLDLDATLASMAPGQFPQSIDPAAVSMRDLLAHTSGIENQGLVLRLAYTGQHDPRTLHRLLSDCQPNERAPNGTFEYSNVGYNIATILSGDLLGIEWQDLLHREVFAPAGLTRSGASVLRAQEQGWSIARGHWAGTPDGISMLRLQKTDSTMHSAGGVIMSANDALRWLELMIRDGQIGSGQALPAKLVAATREPLAAITGDEDYSAHHYGLGWYLSSYRGEPMVHHFGDYDGCRAHVSYLPERRIGTAVFVNESSASWWLVHGIANYVYDRLTGRDDAQERLGSAIVAAGAEREEWIKRVRDDRAERSGLAWSLSREREAYTGAYEDSLLGRMVVSEEDGELIVQFGQLSSVAGASSQPETALVEFFPFRRGGLTFEGEGTHPDALRFRGVRFARMQ